MHVTYPDKNWLFVYVTILENEIKQLVESDTLSFHMLRELKDNVC